HPSLSIFMTMTFIPRFIAAFWVLRRVRRLGFRNTKPNVLYFPKASCACGLAFKASASLTIASKLSTSATEKNLFIFVVSYQWSVISDQFFLILCPAGIYLNTQYL